MNKQTCYIVCACVRATTPKWPQQELNHNLLIKKANALTTWLCWLTHTDTHKQSKSKVSSCR